MSLIIKNPRTLALSGLVALLALADVSRAELTVFQTDNQGNAQKAPPKPNGGNGWAPVGAAGVTIKAKQTIWLACNNNLWDGEYKNWTLTLTSTGNPLDVDQPNLLCPGQTGFDEKGKPVFTWLHDGFTKGKGPRKLYVHLKPQPVWERVELKNNTAAAITFTVTGVNSCDNFAVAANTLSAPTCFFGAVGPGVMLSNQFITQVMVFPQTLAIDPSRPPTFSAPASSGNWLATPVYENPDGGYAPLGGILFTCDGLGLAPGDPCGLSFAMQGPAADMQYKMYAYDDVMQEFQEYNWDLRPSVGINKSNNTLGLQFNSVLGETYTVLSSLDLSTWHPVQTIPGTGDIINWQAPMSGQVGFFRVSCQAAPISTNPPAVVGISAPISSTAVVVTFNELVDSLTATQPGNYFLFGGSAMLPIQSVSLLGSRAVELMLAAPLAPGNNYALGVRGVSDHAGHVMAPSTFPFSTVSLQTPCPGGTLLARQTYSECNPDGFWHVVEDDWYQCPNGAVQKFRVADTATTQRCGPTQTPPNPVGLLYATDAGVVSAGQSFNEIGPISVCIGSGGLWANSSYVQYQSLDGTLYMRGPIQTEPMIPATPCTQAPPSPVGTLNCNTCQVVGYLGQVHHIPECFAGLWCDNTYNQYQCADGTVCESGPVASVPLSPATPCDQPPPAH